MDKAIADNVLAVNENVKDADAFRTARACIMSKEAQHVRRRQIRRPAWSSRANGCAAWRRLSRVGFLSDQAFVVTCSTQWRLQGWRSTSGVWSGKKGAQRPLATAKQFSVSSERAVKLAEKVGKHVLYSVL
jgi:hypothetical protein